MSANVLQWDGSPGHYEVYYLSATDPRSGLGLWVRYTMLAPLHAARTNAQIARAARGAPVEAVALAGGENARRWLDELRHVRLQITGDDLLAAGIPEGPEIGARLQRALDRKLDGEVSGREPELAAALEGEG